jgi:hypothetical protein
MTELITVSLACWTTLLQPVLRVAESMQDSSAGRGLWGCPKSEALMHKNSVRKLPRRFRHVEMAFDLLVAEK